MNADKKSTVVPQSNQTSAERETHSLSREKGENAPTFHVQTGLKAGEWYPTKNFDAWFDRWF